MFNNLLCVVKLNTLGRESLFYVLYIRTCYHQRLFYFIFLNQSEILYFNQTTNELILEYNEFLRSVKIHLQMLSVIYREIITSVDQTRK